MYIDINIHKMKNLQAYQKGHPLSEVNGAKPIKKKEPKPFPLSYPTCFYRGYD